MSAREELYAAVMSGGEHSPERSERASARIDAFRAEVLREAAAHLRRTDRNSRSYPAALTGARIIETELIEPAPPAT